MSRAFCGGADEGGGGDGDGVRSGGRLAACGVSAVCCACCCGTGAGGGYSCVECDVRNRYKKR